MLERSFKGLLGHADFNILGAGRTDAGVSCLNGAFEFFTTAPLSESQDLLDLLNEYLPDDIRILSFQKVGLDFNVIQDVKEKEYRYHFASGEKPHPFSAPHVVMVPKKLDVDLMQEGAQCFQGTHDFRRFCTKPKPETQFQREIALCEIIKNQQEPLWCGPKAAFVLRVRGKGFLRNQVRLMMGALFDLGLGEISLADLKAALDSLETSPLSQKAPARGLVLQEVVFDEK